MRFLEKMPVVVVTVLLAGAVVFAGNLAARAQFTTYERLQNQLTSRRTGVDVRVIEQRELRQEFQVQQQRNRQQERRGATKPMDLRVPTMRPTCRLPITGNAYANAPCR